MEKGNIIEEDIFKPNEIEKFLNIVEKETKIDKNHLEIWDIVKNENYNLMKENLKEIVYHGINLVNEFIRLNYTGPLNDELNDELDDEIQLIKQENENIEENFEKIIPRNLIKLTENPIKKKKDFFIGLRIIELACNLMPECIKLKLLKVRYYRILQSLSESKNNSFFSIMKNLYLEIEHFQNEPEIKILLKIELILLHIEFNETIKAKEILDEIFENLKINRYMHGIIEKNRIMSIILNIEENGEKKEQLNEIESLLIGAEFNIIWEEISLEPIKDKALAYCEKMINQSSIWQINLSGIYYKNFITLEHLNKVNNSLQEIKKLIRRIIFNSDGLNYNERASYLWHCGIISLYKLNDFLGTQYLKRGLTISAIEHFKFCKNWKKLIECYIITNQKDKAIKNLEALLQIEPENYEYLYLYGLVMNNPIYLEKSWEISKKSFPIAKKELGKLYFKNKAYEKAISNFLEFISLYPLDLDARFFLGISFIEIKKYKESLTQFIEITNNCPDLTEAWVNLAILHFMTNNFDLASYAIKRASSLNSNNLKIWNLSLKIHLKTKSIYHVCDSMHKLFWITGEVDWDCLDNILNSFVPFKNSFEIEQLNYFFDTIQDNNSFKIEYWSLKAKICFFTSNLDDFEICIDKIIILLDQMTQKKEKLLFIIIKTIYYNLNFYLKAISKNNSSPPMLNLIEKLIKNLKRIFELNRNLYNNISQYKTIKNLFNRFDNLLK